jgi:hypothetical protein
MPSSKKVKWADSIQSYHHVLTLQCLYVLGTLMKRSVRAKNKSLVKFTESKNDISPLIKITEVKSREYPFSSSPPLQNRIKQIPLSSEDHGDQLFNFHSCFGDSILNPYSHAEHSYVQNEQLQLIYGESSQATKQHQVVDTTHVTSPMVSRAKAHYPKPLVESSTTRSTWYSSI